MSAPDPLADATPSSRSVIESARNYERDRYLSALLAPAEARADLVTLAAYLGEIKRIPLLARDPTVGEIRLQWWRDTLAGSGEPSGHPVADAVTELAQRRSLRRDLLLAPLEGYSRELYEDGIRDGRELSLYAEETDGAAIRLALAILGAPNAQDAEQAVDPAARALALTRLALSLPQHLAHGRRPLPEEFASRAHDPRGGGPSEAREATDILTRLLAEEAFAALKGFRDGKGRMDSGLVTAFLPMCLVEPYLKSLLKPGRDVLLEVADISPLSRVVRLWFAHLRGHV